MTRNSRLITIGVAVAAAGIGLAGCSSSSTTSDASTPAMSQDTMSGSPDAMMSSAAFGPGCAAVPETGAGSFDGMAAAPVATAASNNPALSTLVTAVKAAGLDSTLNSADGITVFAPSNDAFKAVPEKTLTALLDDPKGDLTKVLTYHVVPGQLTPTDLAGEHKTLEGQDLKVTGSGESFKVNGANVVCGNVKTANATVYIVDGVLSPPAK